MTETTAPAARFEIRVSFEGVKQFSLFAQTEEQAEETYGDLRGVCIPEALVEVIDHEEDAPAHSSTFTQAVEMERLDKTLTALAVMGSDAATRERNSKARAKNRAALAAIQDTWSLADWAAYVIFRKQA